MAIEIKTTITIKLPGVEQPVELTKEQASELTDLLLKQFPEKQRKPVIQVPETPKVTKKNPIDRYPPGVPFWELRTPYVPETTYISRAEQ